MDAESYGYISSQKFINDMRLDLFPLTIDANDTEALKKFKIPPLIKSKNIKNIIEIGEIYPILNDYYGQFYLHFDNTEASKSINTFKNDKDAVDFIINDFASKKQNYPNINFKTTDNARSLPPGSSHSFKRANFNTSAIIISDYNMKFYENKFLGSTFDQFSENEIDEKILS